MAAEDRWSEHPAQKMNDEDPETDEEEEIAKQLRGYIPDYLDSPLSRVNIRAAFAGCFIAIALIFLAILITNRVEGAGISGFISETTAAIFLGSSTGHFFGMALRKDGDKITSFLLGSSLTLATALTQIVGVSFRGGVLIMFAGGVFLMHNSGLVDSREEIRNYVTFFSENASAYVLTGLAIWQYLRPLVMSWVNSGLPFGL